VKKKTKKKVEKEITKIQNGTNIPKERKRKRRKWKISQEKKIKLEKKTGDITRKKILRFILFCVILILIFLSIRIGYIQLIKGKEYARYGI